MALFYTETIDLWHYFQDTIHDRVATLPSSRVVSADMYKGRLDLLAYEEYNNPMLWWILAEYNSILDPIDFNHETLSIPSVIDVSNFLNELKLERNARQ